MTEENQVKRGYDSSDVTKEEPDTVKGRKMDVVLQISNKGCVFIPCG